MININKEKLQKQLLFYVRNKTLLEELIDEVIKPNSINMTRKEMLNHAAALFYNEQITFDSFKRALTDQYGYDSIDGKVVEFRDKKLWEFLDIHAYTKKFNNKNYLLYENKSNIIKEARSIYNHEWFSYLISIDDEIPEIFGINSSDTLLDNLNKILNNYNVSGYPSPDEFQKLYKELKKKIIS